MKFLILLKSKFRKLIQKICEQNKLRKKLLKKEKILKNLKLI